MAESAKPITIILAEDHTIVRQGLRVLLEAEPGLQVVGETGDGLEALRLTERFKPDILVSDVSMPGLNGLDVTRQVSKASPHTRVIILSMHSTEAYVAEALRNGAAGYIVKDSTVEDLVRAVREVVAGTRFLSSTVSEPAVKRYVEMTRGKPAEVHDSLTHREREVFQLVVEGHTSAQIGKRLFISPRTVEIHRRMMMKKLGLKNQMELIAYAVKRGIISIDQPAAERQKPEQISPDTKAKAE